METKCFDARCATGGFFCLPSLCNSSHHTIKELLYFLEKYKFIHLLWIVTWKYAKAVIRFNYDLKIRRLISCHHDSESTISLHVGQIWIENIFYWYLIFTIKIFKSHHVEACFFVHVVLWVFWEFYLFIHFH